MSTEPLTYKVAMEELQNIIKEIEQPTVDVDVLAERVKRATTLIKFCKDKLRTAEDEVQKALGEIEQSQEEELF